ncbi:hypothetical protein FOA52_000869 [Chlamydomonas sp. UWO 241]|nr:hypothetical protein FOA52_000869 [Chlamydomonas sp. UWO 241]
MQPLIQPDAATRAEVVSEASPHLGASVLLNGLLFKWIWTHADAADKKQLRAVARDVRAMADGLIVALSMHGKPASQLGSALVRWSDVQRLAAVCDDESAAVISAAPLSKLKALSLEHKGAGNEWSVPALSRTATAGLEELCFNARMFPRSSTLLILEEAVRGCSQLCTLSLSGCRVLDLSALAGCVHLEKLSAFGFIGCFSSDISDLASLGGCAKLEEL